MFQAFFQAIALAFNDLLGALIAAIMAGLGG